MISKIQQNVLRSVLTMVTLTAFVWAFVVVAPQEALAAVPAGTIVQVATTSQISPENVMVGDPVQMRVVSDVSVNGRVVITAGAEARGEVTSVQKKGMLGKPAKIGIAVRSVKAADGTTVMVSGSKVVEGDDQMPIAIITTLLCLLGVLIKGGDAVITAGTPIQCTTN